MGRTIGPSARLRRSVGRAAGLPPVRRRPFAAVLAALALTVSAGASTPVAQGARDTAVRADAGCGHAARIRLELRARDGGLHLGWALRYGRARERWRVVVVHEGRVAWRGTRTVSRFGDLRLRLGLRDLPGADRVEVRASGPRGTTCGIAATLRG